MTPWLSEHPEIRNIRAAVSDLNGQARGKRMPARFGEKLLSDGSRMPMSVLNVDIWGDDIHRRRRRRAQTHGTGLCADALARHPNGAVADVDVS